MQNAWPYVIAAYAVTGLGLAALVAYGVLRLRHWARLAKAESAR